MISQVRVNTDELHELSDLIKWECELKASEKQRRWKSRVAPVLTTF